MSFNKSYTSESLSQDEIDLLFSGGGEPAPPPLPQRGPDVQVYDFRRPARISKERKRSLEAIYSLLAKSVESWLAGRMRDTVSLELESVEELTFGEFLLALPSPCASFIFDVRGSGGQQGVMDFGHVFAYFAVDRLLGGMGQPALLERSLTPTERMLVRIVAERMAFQLAEVWEDYVKMDLVITGFESIPEMLHIANREDPVLVTSLNVMMGEMSSPILLCLPFTVLEPFFTTSATRKVHVARGTPEERAVERRTIEETLKNARIPVQARFPPTRLKLADLMNLKVGDVLLTRLPVDSELHLYVSGQRRYAGLPGRVGQHLAVRVTSVLEVEPRDILEPGRVRMEL